MSDKRPLSPISDTSSVLSLEDEQDGDESYTVAEAVVSTLTQSLTTPEGKNIAECVDEMTSELRKLRDLLQELVTLGKSK